MAENLPANAGAMGSIPGPGRSHMPGATKPGPQLQSPCAVTAEAFTPGACALQREATAIRSQHTATGE